MDIRFAIRALEVPSDEPPWQSFMLSKLGLPEKPFSDRALAEDDQPPRHPKPLYPAI
jgi:hypothetical protein